MARPAARDAVACWAAAASAGCLLLGFAAAPAAQAAFTTQAVAQAVVGTATIGSPTDTSVVPVCSSKKTLTLTVNVRETVPYANFLDVTITSGTESTNRVQPVGSIESHTLTISAAKGSTVDYTYTVRGLYTPVNSTNTWRSATPLTRTVSCS
ncbi:hypothetical protein ACFWIX_02555 [Pseudarthrobacter sp. NPDC058362]|uniref:hypothetical protein n=1 Tax=Pseudarthrobacter sp. NPDC058362 TaxID=3346458 RepID=UPI00365D637E